VAHRLDVVWQLSLDQRARRQVDGDADVETPSAPGAHLAQRMVEQEAGDFANSTAVAHPHLSFLGDVFAVPASWPVSNVFSVGDVILVAAALLALHCLCGSRLALVRFAAPPLAR
jgi:hypothetical protein